MKHNRNKFIATLLISGSAFLFGTADNAVEAASAPSEHIKFNLTRPEVREIPNITYVQHFNLHGKSLKMDILATKSDKPLPVVLFITEN